MHRAVRQIAPQMDAGRIRYLMGVGTIHDLVVAISSGVDLFDCVMPTRNARNGHVFTSEGRIVIKNSCYRDDPRVLDPACDCVACAGGFSRAYLRHLFQAREILAHRLMSAHNLRVYARLMADARQAILQDRLKEWADGVTGRRADSAEPG